MASLIVVPLPHARTSGSLGTSGSKSWEARRALSSLFRGALGTSKGSALVAGRDPACRVRERRGVSKRQIPVRVACEGCLPLLSSDVPGQLIDHCWDCCWDKRNPAQPELN